MNPRIKVNTEGYKVKVKITIAVMDADGKDVLNLKPRDYEYEVEKTHPFYLRAIRNFVSKSLTNPNIVIGKAVRAKWEAILQRVEKHFTTNGIPFHIEKTNEINASEVETKAEIKEELPEEIKPVKKTTKRASKVKPNVE